MKKFSIIIPVYNVEKYLQKCLDSLTMQTYDMNMVQIILIDDGSSDGSGKICQEYVNKYNYFEYHYFPRDRNSGLGNARNKGMEFITGKYFMYLDSDDYYNQDAIKIIAENLDKYADVSLLIFDYKRVYEHPTLLQKIYQPNKKQQKNYGKLTSKLATSLSHCAWNKVFKTEKYHTLRFKNTLYEDIALTSIMFVEKDILVVEDVLLNYLIRKDSLMTQNFSLNKVTQNIINYQEIASDIDTLYERDFYYRFLKYGYMFSIFTLKDIKQERQLFNKYLNEATELIHKYNLKNKLSLIEKIFFIVMKFKF